MQYNIVEKPNKYLPNEELLDKLFHLKNPANIKTDFIMENHEVIIGNILQA